MTPKQTSPKPSQSGQANPDPVQPAPASSPGSQDETKTPAPGGGVRVSAVISSWNKIEDLRQNLDAIAVQERPFDQVVVVDNRSTDGSIEMVREKYPWAQLVVMPHSNYGACETFNIGFACANGEFTAILDDDVILPPHWVKTMLEKFSTEEDSTAILSSKVVEPGMPDEFRNDPEVNRERFMATFRGCASMARTDRLEEAGYYDEKFFIYGNERDLSARIMNLGCRIKQFPTLEVLHKTPFGMKMGKRSLYYHVRNLWWYLFKNCSVASIFVFFFRQLTGPFRSQENLPKDSVGAIGGMKNITGTPGGVWIAMRATFAAFAGLPYCLKNRKVCKAPDFRLPGE